MFNTEEYTKEQWAEEMAGARAAGCRVMDFDEWLAYRHRIDSLFDDMMLKDANLDSLEVRR